MKKVHYYYKSKSSKYWKFPKNFCGQESKNITVSLSFKSVTCEKCIQKVYRQNKLEPASYEDIVKKIL